jgi:hypothetical protein
MGALIDVYFSIPDMISRVSTRRFHFPRTLRLTGFGSEQPERPLPTASDVLPARKGGEEKDGPG